MQLQNDLPTSTIQTKFHVVLFIPQYFITLVACAGDIRVFTQCTRIALITLSSNHMQMLKDLRCSFICNYVLMTAVFVACNTYATTCIQAQTVAIHGGKQCLTEHFPKPSQAGCLRIGVIRGTI